MFITLLFITQLFITYLLSKLAGDLYRKGGIGHPYNTRYRDIGCSIIMYLTMFCWIGLSHWLSLLLCFGLMWGALSTYWKKKNTDVQWYNWLFTGLGYSFSMLPLTLVTKKYIGFCLRTTVLTVFVTLWSQFIGDVELEEKGRGIINNITLPLLLL